MDHLFSRSGAAEKAPLAPMGSLQTAVILAEGRQKGLSGSAGLELLPDGVTVLDRLMRNLENGGIKKFVIVAGYEFDRFREKYGSRQDVVLIENPRWKWTGSMASLALAAPISPKDFWWSRATLCWSSGR